MKLSTPMLRVALLHFKEKAPVYASIYRPQSGKTPPTADEIRGPKFRKYPFHSQHRWNLEQKLKITEYTPTAVSNTTFIFSYNPAVHLTKVRQLKRLLEWSLPGVKVLTEASQSTVNLSVYRMSDSRMILGSAGIVKGDCSGDEFIKACQFY